ncbi:hypothetical protein GLU01_01695 [Nanohaloarchaea archaeon]|nr:hypothetical protein [Candidatus Nanohaloarchaea archaeon]
MSEINLANWEIVDDAANNKIVIRSKTTGQQIELNESGVFKSSGQIDINSLAFNTIDIAGNTVKLGATLSLDHSDLSNITPDDHHAKYTDENAQDAIGTILNNHLSYDDANNTIDVTPGTINHDNLSSVNSADHHAKYTDTNAQNAVDGANVSIGGDADTVDGFDIEKNGTDGSGVINFKT